MLRSLLLAALAVSLLSPNASAQGSATACGFLDQEVIVDVANGNAQLRVNVYTIDGVLRFSKTVNAATRNGCGLLIETNNAGVQSGGLPPGIDDWRFGDPVTQPELRLLTVEFVNETTPFQSELVGRYTYNVCNTNDKLNGFGFYCSRTGIGVSDDIRFRYDVARGEILVRPDGVFNSDPNVGVADFFPGEEDAWILPYSMETLCTTTTCGSGQLYTNKDVFVTPIHGNPASGSFITPQYRDWTLPNHDMNVYDNAVGSSTAGSYRGYVWDLGGKAVRFQPNTRLLVDGEIEVSNGTLTAANLGSGWAGIVARSGFDAFSEPFSGDVTLGAGTIVTGTNTPHGAVRAEGGASVTLDGAIVENNTGGPGVVAAGGSPSAARVTVAGSSKIYGHASAAGVLAENGGFVDIIGDGVEIYNSARGVEARTGGARVLVTAGKIRNNTGGPGVRAGAGGTVDLWAGYGDGGGGSSDANASTIDPIEVRNNVGGLYAEASAGGFGNGSGGGVITTASNAVCVKEPCPYTVTGQNSFKANRGTTTDTQYDMVAQTGSLVDATENFWDTQNASEVEFPASDAPRISYLPILTQDPAGSSATRSGTAGRRTSGEPAGGALDGPDFSGVALAVATADRLRLGNGPEEAAAALVAAHRSATTDDERALVAAGAARLLRDTPDGTLWTWAQAAAELPGTDRPWARRALAEAWLARERTGDAAQAAQALADQDGAAWAESETAASHRVAGLTLVLRAAILDRDRTAAEQALGALAEVDADEAAVLAVMAAAALGDIETAPKRSEAPMAAASAASASLDVWPNPSAGALTVRVHDATGQTEVALFDALGRHVATLHDGAADGPLALPFDGSALAPGVYVVRVRSETGIAARSVTVAR